MQGEDNYVLRCGEEGARRLRLLARVKWPSTRLLLHRAGIRKGIRCLDVGCGIGEVTLQMARMVGPSGKAVGMDIDEPYLEQARQESARHRFNVVFHKADALNLCVESTYELVYRRYLLTHLYKPDVAVEIMIKAIRPGGTIVVEDVDFPGHVCYPHYPAFERYVELYQAVVRLNGGDPTFGPRLYGLLKEVGASHLSVDISHPTFC